MVTASLYVVGVCVNRIGRFKRRPELGGGLGGERAFEQTRATAIDGDTGGQRRLVALLEFARGAPSRGPSGAAPIQAPPPRH